jgi:hypothetical protein
MEKSLIRGLELVLGSYISCIQDSSCRQSLIKTDLPDVKPGVLGRKNQQEKSAFSAGQSPIRKR